MRWLGGLAVTLAVLALVGAAPASAATFTVLGTTDGTGACVGSVCPTLRSAVSAANSSPGPDQITLGAGTFRLELASKTQEDANATGDLDVSGDLTITGAGAQATTILAAFPAAESDRVIQATGGANLALTDLTVSGGNIQLEVFTHGGGVDSAGAGTLDLERVLVSGNTVKDLGNAGAAGAGVYKGGGHLVINNSAILSNASSSGDGIGGGAYVAGTASGEITNTTFAGNSATKFAGALGSESPLAVMLSFVTVTSNQSAMEDGGVFGEQLQLRDSIVAGNSAPTSADCENTKSVRPPIDAGGNVGGSSCSLTQASDATTFTPLLGPLEGSPIPYLEPLAGSPALDRALAPCPATDVRGVARPQGGACDSGAVERVVPLTSSPLPLIAPGGGKPTGAKAPSLSAVSQSHSVWRAGNKLARIAKRVPVGTVFSFALDQSAGVTLTFTQFAPGRRAGGRCVVPRPANRHKRSCKRTVTRGTLTLAGHAGKNKVSFQGRISASRKLKPGAYKVQIAAKTAAGRSQTRTLSFTIVK